VTDAWVFDVDGCLVDSITGTSLRPLTRDVITSLRSRGIAVILWSAGGAAYSEQRARQFEIDHLFDAFHGKEERDGDGRWRIDHLEGAHRPRVFVDDRPEELPDRVEVIGVSPYLGESRHDRGLSGVLELASRK
jgi:long-chain acyl-CoA synthetase